MKPHLTLVGESSEIPTKWRLSWPLFGAGAAMLLVVVTLGALKAGYDLSVGWIALIALVVWAMVRGGRQIAPAPVIIHHHHHHQAER